MTDFIINLLLLLLGSMVALVIIVIAVRFSYDLLHFFGIDISYDFLLLSLAIIVGAISYET